MPYVTFEATENEAEKAPLLSKEWRRKWAEYTRERMIRRMFWRKYPFKEHVVEWINECLEAGGTPTFQGIYAGKPLKVDDEYALIGKCVKPERYVHPGAFTDVPEEDWKVSVLYRNEWKWYLWKYGGGRERGEPEPELRPAYGKVIAAVLEAFGLERLK